MKYNNKNGILSKTYEVCRIPIDTMSSILSENTLGVLVQVYDECVQLGDLISISSPDSLKDYYKRALENKGDINKISEIEKELECNLYMTWEDLKLHHGKEEAEILFRKRFPMNKSN